ncbi:MAG TPA: PAS domain S-box protein [Pseudobdellovibrionaceae bacterium]|nr:PAS domain S-box protein [Pseudobdellovibrionaceae bacterium]
MPNRYASQSRVFILSHPTPALERWSEIMKREGYECLWTDQAEKALDSAREFRPDLILVCADFVGARSCPDFKALPELSSCFLVLSFAPHHLENATLDGHSIRFDDYLSYEIPEREYLLRLKSFMRHKSQYAQLRASEAAMAVSEEKFRLLARATNDTLWDWDLTNDSLWWNDGIELLFGYKKSEVLPDIRSWTNYIHADDYLSVNQTLDQAFKNTRTNSWSAHYRFQKADGSFAFVLDRGHIMRDAKGTPVRMVGGMTDLTERKATEEKLREQAALLEKAQDAIIVRDLQHKILFWNSSAVRIYGWPKSEAIGKNIQTLLYSDPTHFLNATRTVLSKGEWTGELEQRTKDGRSIVIEGHWNLVTDEKGQPKSILVINTDITHKKKLEEQFLRVQRMESIGTLAGGVAHDLNNILTPILLSVDLLKMEIQDPKSVERLDNIGRSARRGAEMVSQVLSFARGMEGQRIEIEPATLIRDVVQIISETFPKNIQIDCKLADDPWNLIADPTQLHQVLLNLCVNSRDAMPNGGRLKLSVENMVIDEHYAAMNIEARVGPHIKIEVEDTGSGIPKAIMEKIFDPFFTTKEVGKGTGLGLSTSLAIVKSHGGFIRAYSDPGMGARFRIYIPAVTEARDRALLDPALNMPRGRGELVLVVDDEASIRQITKQTLEAFGYRVLLAVDGSEAVSTYVQHRDEVAVVLTDMMMPVMDGPATIQVLLKINPKIRIIGASGITGNGKVLQSADAGLKHFLPKPYTADTLLKAIRKILDE